jgi:uncharacterized protein
MPSVPRRLTLLEKKLEELPDDCEPMFVSQLEGYLAGIIVCPDAIMPSEWLPMIWDTSGEKDGPVFESAKQAEKLERLVMDHYHATVADITAGRYVPVYDVDTRNDDVLWEMWIDGFEQAMQFRPESWNAYLDVDEDTTTAIAGLMMLVEIANGDSKLDETEIKELQVAAPDLIPGWIEFLNAARMTRHQQGASESKVLTGAAAKAGRNELCPCGSGKKYKMCCGLN